MRLHRGYTQRLHRGYRGAKDRKGSSSSLSWFYCVPFFINAWHVLSRSGRLGRWHFHYDRVLGHPGTSSEPQVILHIRCLSLQCCIMMRAARHKACK